MAFDGEGRSNSSHSCLYGRGSAGALEAGSGEDRWGPDEVVLTFGDHDTDLSRGVWNYPTRSRDGASSSDDNSDTGPD